MVYVIQVCWHIPLLYVQWKTPDNGKRNCPKHVEFYSKNKFEKLVHLVGFVIRADEILVWARHLMYSVNSSTANGRRFIRSVVETNPRDIQTFKQCCSGNCRLRCVLLYRPSVRGLSLLFVRVYLIGSENSCQTDSIRRVLKVVKSEH